MITTKRNIFFLSSMSYISSLSVETTKKETFR